jgi:hypothetical protein
MSIVKVYIEQAAKLFDILDIFVEICNIKI